MIKFYFQASRVKNVIIAIFCCLIAIFKVSSNDYIDIFFSSIIVIFLMVASNFVNDIFDMKVDRINKPNRPLIKHPKLKKNFQWIAFALFFISLIISFCINNMAALIVVFSIPVLLAYTPFLKGVPLIGNIVVSFYLSFSDQFLS